MKKNMNKKEANALLISLASDYLLKLLPNEVTNLLSDTIQDANKTVENKQPLKNWREKIIVLEHWEGVISEDETQEKKLILEISRQCLFSGKKIRFSYNNNTPVEFNIFGIISRDKHFYLAKHLIYYHLEMYPRLKN